MQCELPACTMLGPGWVRAPPEAHLMPLALLIHTGALGWQNTCPDYSAPTWARKRVQRPGSQRGGPRLACLLGSSPPPTQIPLPASPLQDHKHWEAIRGPARDGRAQGLPHQQESRKARGGPLQQAQQRSALRPAHISPLLCTGLVSSPTPCHMTIRIQPLRAGHGGWDGTQGAAPSGSRPTQDLWKKQLYPMALKHLAEPRPESQPSIRRASEGCQGPQPVPTFGPT